VCRRATPAGVVMAADGSAGDAVSKDLCARRPPRSGTDTGCNITRRASELTSLRCLGTRTTEESIQKVLQMSVASFHWCYLPRKGIDFGAVSYSQQVVGLLTGPSHGLRDA